MKTLKINVTTTIECSSSESSCESYESICSGKIYLVGF